MSRKAKSEKPAGPGVMSNDDLEQLQESVRRQQEEYEAWSRLVEERLNSCDPYYPDLEDDSPRESMRSRKGRGFRPSCYLNEDNLPF